MIYCMSKSKKDKEYTSGVHHGQEGNLLSDVAMEMVPSELTGTYGKGYDYGSSHREEYRRAESDRRKNEQRQKSRSLDDKVSAPTNKEYPKTYQEENQICSDETNYSSYKEDYGEDDYEDDEGNKRSLRDSSQIKKECGEERQPTWGEEDESEQSGMEKFLRFLAFFAEGYVLFKKYNIPRNNGNEKNLKSSSYKMAIEIVSQNGREEYFINGQKIDEEDLPSFLRVRDYIS